jgi:carboxylesterase
MMLESSTALANPNASSEAEMTKLKQLLGPTGFYEPRGKDAVLLIHGLTGTPAEMRHLARKLRRKGFSVMVPQLAGHCGSIKELKRSSWQDWYASVDAAFRFLGDRHHQVFVSGLSMGALLALELAAKHGQQVAGVGLLSPTFFYDGWNMPKLRRSLLPLALMTPLKHFMYWHEVAPYGIKCERTRAMVHAVLENRDAHAAEKVGIFKTPLVTVHESSKLIWHVTQSLAQVQCPVLVVHSTEDDMASTKNVDFVTQRIASKDVETWLIDNTYHVLTLDRRKDDVAERVGNFFSLRAQPAIAA